MIFAVTGNTASGYRKPGSIENEVRQGTSKADLPEPDHGIVNFYIMPYLGLFPAKTIDSTLSNLVYGYPLVISLHF